MESDVDGVPNSSCSYDITVSGKQLGCVCGSSCRARFLEARGKMLSLVANDGWVKKEYKDRKIREDAMMRTR
jgi:hypothetical protein